MTLSSSKCLSKFNSREGDFELMSVLEETIAPTSEVLDKLYHFCLGLELVVPKSTGWSRLTGSFLFLGGNYIFPLSHFFLNEPDCILLDSYNVRVVCCSEFTPVRVALTYR